MRLTKDADPYKYEYSGYGIGSDARSQFSLPDGSLGKNVIIFGVYNSSSVHADNKKKNIIVLAEAKYSISFTVSGKRFLLSLHYNGSKSFLFVNTTKIYINSKQKILK